MNSSDFIDVEKFLFGKGFYDGDLNNTGAWPVISPVVEILAKQRAGKISSADADALINDLRNLDVRNEYEKYVYRAPISRQDYLNFSGGSNTFKYNFSFGFDQTQTVLRDDGHSNRYTINSTTSFKPSNFIEITAAIGLTQSNGRNRGTLQYPVQTGGGKSTIYPYAQFADALGNHLAVPTKFRSPFVDTVGSGQLLDWNYRPLDELKLTDGRNKGTAIRLNLGTKLKFTSWLEGSVLFAYNQENISTRGYFSQETFYTRDFINRYTQFNGGVMSRAIPLGGILNTSNGSARTYNVRGQLNFNKSWSKHAVTGLIAAEVGENKSDATTTRLYGYDDKTLASSANIDYNTVFLELYSNGLRSRIPNQNTYSEGITTRSVDMLANISYTYRNRYNLYASARKDGANIFGTSTNNKWRPLWSLGAGWDISKENFYSVDWMRSLKLRASYGYTGNANNRLSALTTFAIVQGSGNSPYTQLPMSVVSNPPNPGLRWEKIGILNLGVDFTMLNDRLSGSIEWYRKKSTDVIANGPVDRTTGVIFITYNYADLNGHGVDISLHSKNIVTPKFEWSTDLNFSHSKTIVAKYFGGFTTTPISITLNPKVGALAFGLYSYKWMGLDPTNGDPQGMLNKQVSKDYNAIINDSAQNQVFHGSSIPLYYGNLLNTISFGGFAVSFNITYKFDYYFRKGAISYNQLYTGWVGHVEYADRWQQPGDEKRTSVPSMSYPADATRDVFYAGSEVNVEKGDNIRLENIRLQLPAWKNRKSNRFPIRSAHLSIIPANLNLFIWRASKSKLDPDYSGNGFQLPPAKVWSASLSINFK
jgi:hypothetical protein